MKINKKIIHNPNQKDYVIKDKEYYRGINLCLFNLVDSNAKTILEVGCAEGKFGSAVKEKTGGTFYGIERYPPAAKEAKSKIDKVITEDIETTDLPFEKASFDHIIFGDVLEHLKNPWEVLRKIKVYLKDNGSILASIPNVGHISIIESLLSGRWTYTDAGLLDKTHFRFFTLSEIKKMFQDTGYRINQLETIPFTNDRYDKMIDALAEVRKNFGIHDIHFEIEAKSYQYVLKASIQ